MESPWWEYLLRAFARKLPHWAVHELLGQGNSAAVFRITCGDDTAALKLYKRDFFLGDNEAVERYRISLHESLKDHKCPSLVQIVDVGEIEDSAFVLMEYVPWPSLDTVVGAVPVERVPDIIADVSRAARWLLDHHLVHRDIKPANILVSPDFRSAKLVDLGVMRATDGGADLTDHGQRRPFVATAQYSSPEYLFRLVEPSPRLWMGLTIYQIGAILYDLLTGKAIFQEEVASQNRYILAMAVLNQSPQLIRRTGAPVRWAALARRALGKDISSRLRSVSLADFEGLNTIDQDRMRQLLGLEESSELSLLDGVEQQRERIRLLQRGFAEQARDALTHQLRSEGYKRVRWIATDERSVWLQLEVPGYNEISCSVRFSIELDGSRLLLYMGSNLGDDQGAGCEANSLLWEGAIAQFSNELTEEVVPLLSEVVLLKFAKAQDLCAAGLTGTSLPISLDEAQ